MAKTMAMQLLVAIFSLVFLMKGRVDATTFTIQNKCSYTVWPATLAGGGSSQLSQTGFTLDPGASVSLDAPYGWSGRVWGRTSCTAGGGFHCTTGDCGNKNACEGAGGAPPATLAEFTLNGSGGQDFFDISLVDGFNLPMSIVPSASCTTVSCSANVNDGCPSELAVTDGCRSACNAFNQEQYCCSGSHNSPSTCGPTNYSQYFKNKCPQAYSYAFDDSSSTFTCSGSNYNIVFCP